MASRVRRANKATASQLLSAVSGVFDLKDVSYSTHVATSSELSEAEKAHIWDMLEHNMQHMYTGSSLGWDPPSKKRELFHRNSRFILLRRSPAEDGLEHLDGELPIMAYSMFRFEMEVGECVLYCYELQVLQSAQRGGMGKTLMGFLYDIARRWNMQKVTLTVFKENQAAFLLYKAMGFTVEPDGDGEDYWIMAKS
ncbi:acyl-CoA N-acyltransferase [Russula ochroleuca]|jgi:ribosomal protein S18 acetylase RimI-like enzyme|uniref:N-alpha-acetyltransferase 40 n=1 Tax=Russula ochroleuca TaxID=152965 RepID=A0A9P5MXL4_9AGAM|nr:acyl-CoA N-acyltransferase [Russula ochroleuca]